MEGKVLRRWRWEGGGKVPKKKVEMGRWRARYKKKVEIGEVEGKVPKKKVEMGVEGKVPKKKVEMGRWRARYLRRRWRLGGGGQGT